MIEFAAETHPGNRYQHNEDSLGWSEEAGVWLVADGMGGHACGDVASRTAKQSMLRELGADDHAANKPLTALIDSAHEAIVNEGIKRSAENMGSTVVAVRLRDAKLEVAWCGDSRVYLWRNEELIRLTRDHSLLEQLLESGVVEPEEAFGHPQKHVLVQALGITNPPPKPAQLEAELANNDMLLLCSDGLHDELRDDDINQLLIGNPEPSSAASALVKRVLQGPARDNISVVCIRVTELARAQNPPLTVTQLRERYERLPGRRKDRVSLLLEPTPEPDPTERSLNASSDSITPVHTPKAPPVMAAPKIALPVASDKKSGLSEFDRDLLIALAAVSVLVALLLWIT